MFTVTVQKLKLMISVIFAVFPNTQRDYCRHFSGSWISGKRSMLLVSWYRQRLVHNSSCTYIFAKVYPPCSAVCLQQLTYLYCYRIHDGDRHVVWWREAFWDTV